MRPSKPACHHAPRPDAAACVAQVGILSIARDIAQGMAYLHALNVCHGDLKCENVLLCFAEGVGSSVAPDGSGPAVPFHAKVADFGLSKTFGEASTHMSTATVGTVTHMPPELLLTGQLRPSSDVYSFGVICEWRTWLRLRRGQGGHGGHGLPSAACRCPGRTFALGWSIRVQHRCIDDCRVTLTVVAAALSRGAAVQVCNLQHAPDACPPCLHAACSVAAGHGRHAVRGHAVRGDRVQGGRGRHAARVPGKRAAPLRRTRRGMLGHRPCCTAYL